MSTPTLIVIAVAVALPVLLAVGLWLAHARRDRHIAADVASLLAQIDAAGPPITEADLEPLPELVQRWLRHAGAVGRPPIRSYRMRQRGRMRTGPDGDWLTLAAEEYGRVPGPGGRPGFVWNARTRLNGVPLSAHDRYQDGRGAMRLHLAHALPLSHTTGPEVDTAALVRWLAQLPWAPTFALDPRIRWTRIDERAVEATVRDGEVEASVQVLIDGRGRVDEVRAQRPRATPDGYVTRPWSMRLLGGHVVDGLAVPEGSECMWDPDDAPFCYVQIGPIDVLEYDVAERLPDSGV